MLCLLLHLCVPTFAPTTPLICVSQHLVLLAFGCVHLLSLCLLSHLCVPTFASATPFIHVSQHLVLLAFGCVHLSSLWLAPICVCPLSPLLAPSFTFISPFSHALGCTHPLAFLFVCASPQVQMHLPLLSLLFHLHQPSPLFALSCTC